MKKKYRLKSQKEISLVFANKTKYGDGHFVIYYRSSKNSHFRYAISIGKKYGKAHERNLCKRRIRHIILELSPNLANYEFVIVVRSEVSELSFEMIKERIVKLLKRSKILENEEKR